MTASRREFVKHVSLATAGLSVLSSNDVFAKTKDAKDAIVNLGFIGVGLRGQGHLSLSLARKDVNVVAICDVDSKMLEMSSALIKKSGKTPDTYCRYKEKQPPCRHTANKTKLS